MYFTYIYSGCIYNIVLFPRRIIIPYRVPPRCPHTWFCHADKASIDALIESLNSTGFRESMLLFKIKSVYDKITIPPKPSATIEGEVEANLPPTAAFKEVIQYLIEMFFGFINVHGFFI